jgi:hypothetical protein
VKLALKRLIACPKAIIPKSDVPICGGAKPWEIVQPDSPQPRLEIGKALQVGVAPLLLGRCDGDQGNIGSALPVRLDEGQGVDSLRPPFGNIENAVGIEREGLREVGVPSDATKALGGWARSGGVEERYGQGTRPATLARWMAKVEYPALDLAAIGMAR